MTDGFHDPEALGAWSNGPEGRVLLRLDRALPEGTRLRAELGFFGSAAMGTPRQLSLSLRRAGDDTMPLLDEGVVPPLGEVRFVIGKDQIASFELPLPVSDAPLDVVLHLGIDRAASPSELKLSDDPRQLGVLLRALELVEGEAASDTRVTPIAKKPHVAAE